MTNIAAYILDFWGAGDTPSNAYNYADGLLNGDNAPLMDVLRKAGTFPHRAFVQIPFLSANMKPMQASQLIIASNTWS